MPADNLSWLRIADLESQLQRKDALVRDLQEEVQRLQAALQEFTCKEVQHKKTEANTGQPSNIAAAAWKRPTILHNISGTGRLQLERPLVVFDLETTGLSRSTGRIVEFGAVKLFPNGRRRSFRFLINPGTPISPYSSQVHKIRDRDVVDKPLFVAHADSIMTIFQDSDICGFNAIRFDVPFLAAELARCDSGIEFPPKGARVIDTMVFYHRHEPKESISASEASFSATQNDLQDTAASRPSALPVSLPLSSEPHAAACNSSKSGTLVDGMDLDGVHSALSQPVSQKGSSGMCSKLKSPKRDLTAALKLYCGCELVDAHTALADVDATLRVLLAQLERYEHLPTDVQGLHDFCNTPPPRKLASAASQAVGNAGTEEVPRRPSTNMAAALNGSLRKGISLQSDSSNNTQHKQSPADKGSTSSSSSSMAMPGTGCVDTQQYGAASAHGRPTINTAGHQQDSAPTVISAKFGTAAPASKADSLKGQLQMCNKSLQARAQATDKATSVNLEGQKGAASCNAMSTEDVSGSRFSYNLARNEDGLQQMRCKHLQSGQASLTPPTQEQTEVQPAADAAVEGVMEQDSSITGEFGDLEGLPECEPVSFVDGHRRFVWHGMEAAFAFGKHRGALLRDVAESSPGYLRWILETGFAHETQSIVAGALLGDFPVRAQQGSQATTCSVSSM